jgi:hypothetical protein
MRYEDVYAEISAGTARRTVPRWATGVLREIANGRRRIRAVRHPLGFRCLPLERRQDLGVCLHLWLAEPYDAPTTSQVHCHSWDLLSLVLSGEIGNVPALIGEGRSHRVFEVVSRGDVDEIRATPRTVHYAPAPTEPFRTGDVYRVPAGTFHSTAVAGWGEAVTLALGRSRPDGVDLSLGSLDGLDHSVRRLHCDDAETSRTATAGVRLLSHKP